MIVTARHPLTRRLSGPLWAWYLIGCGVATFLYVAVPPFKGYAGLINLIGLVIAGRDRSSASASIGPTRCSRGCLLVLRAAAVRRRRFLHVQHTRIYSAAKSGSRRRATPSISLSTRVCSPAYFFLSEHGTASPTGGADRLVDPDGRLCAALVGVPRRAERASVRLVTACERSCRLPTRSAMCCCSPPRFGSLSTQGRQQRRRSSCWLARIVALLATDCAYNYALLQGTYNHQLIYDVGWIAYLVLWGAATLHPSMRTLEQPVVDVRTRLTSHPARRSWRPPCLISPADPIRPRDSSNPDTIVVILALRCSVFVLVVARMAGLVRQ